MNKLLVLIIGLLITSGSSFGQTNATLAQTKIMTLGVFHFDYPNLDAVQTKEEDKITVLDEPFQSEIIAICKAIEEFNPSIIAIEGVPAIQPIIDSLYQQYKADKFELKKNEIYQLGFRLGKQLQLDKIYCVDNQGKHYEHVEAIFQDSVRLSKFEDYFINSRDTVYELPISTAKVSSVIDVLYASNEPKKIKESLAPYLLHPFKYEEHEGDFTGVDFESGRWFNRNLRIFRNIQRIPHNSDDRILLIIGSGHLNLLNLFFDTSREFEFVSPIPYLEKAKQRK
ncbi:MAG: DUF5694 domain-containing protein [Bacteroidetes bacterium]|jgi:hypothetical protein|nr:DUF5694 domain-containing protein [Bacteroidota bacterium]